MPDLTITVEDCDHGDCPLGRNGCEAVVARGAEPLWVEAGQPSTIAWRSHAPADSTHAACRLGELTATDARTGQPVAPVPMCPDCSAHFRRRA